MNRKRSHDDLEDADECLPISKRINSLHLEGKKQRLDDSQDHQMNGFPNNNNINPATILSPHSLAGGSSLPFPTHLPQNGGPCLPQQHHLNPVGDKPQTISTDYNYNVASSSNMTVPPPQSYSHAAHHLPMQNVYHHQGALNAQMTTDPAMLHVNTGIMSHPAHHHQHSFPCSPSHQQHSHHTHSLAANQHPHYQHLPCLYPTPSTDPFINQQQIPLSSPTDVRLANGHYATSIAHIDCHSLGASGSAATNLALGQCHHARDALEEDLPSGPYDPELKMSENPHYYDTNKLLYEAHLSRLQRIVPDYQLHS